MATVRIFTDGACSGNPGPGGWAAIFSTQKETRILKGHDCETTNNRMELLAVVKALEKVLRCGKVSNHYVILSDSAYVVNSINNNWVINWSLNDWKTGKGEKVKNQDLWEKYLDLIGFLAECDIDHISFVKLKGHSGDPMNEYADKVAKSEALKALKVGGNTNGRDHVFTESR